MTAPSPTRVAYPASDPPHAVYLDYQATTPVDPRVLDAMLPWFSTCFGNPHSTQHGFGRQAAAAVAAARAEVAAAIGADPREIVFTSGATEANNLAIKGAARFLRDVAGSPRDTIVMPASEHKCVLESGRALESEGLRRVVLPVAANGIVDRGAARAAIDGRTALVSVMAVNNEIGVIQPVAEIAAFAHAAGALVHSDAAQALGRIPLDVNDLGVDMMSLSAHKAYGPKGIGALYLRRRPRARVQPLFSGGGQERGARSGTLPAALCVGFGRAAAIAAGERAEETARIQSLRDSFLESMRARIPDLRLNGDAQARAASNLSLAFPGAPALAVLEGLADVALSTGSACASDTVEPSHVLRALGLDDALASATLRVSFGRFTTAEEVDFAARRLADAVAAVRVDESPAVQAAHVVVG